MAKEAINPADSPQTAFTNAYWETTVAAVCMAAEWAGLGWCIYWEYNWT